MVVTSKRRSSVSKPKPKARRKAKAKKQNKTIKVLVDPKTGLELVEYKPETRMGLIETPTKSTKKHRSLSKLKGTIQKPIVINGVSYIYKDLEKAESAGISFSSDVDERQPSAPPSSPVVDARQSPPKAASKRQPLALLPPPKDVSMKKYYDPNYDIDNILERIEEDDEMVEPPSIFFDEIDNVDPIVYDLASKIEKGKNITRRDLRKIAHVLDHLEDLPSISLDNLKNIDPKFRKAIANGCLQQILKGPRSSIEKCIENTLQMDSVPEKDLQAIEKFISEYDHAQIKKKSDEALGGLTWRFVKGLGGLTGLTSYALDDAHEAEMEEYDRIQKLNKKLGN